VCALCKKPERFEPEIHLALAPSVLPVNRIATFQRFAGAGSFYLRDSPAVSLQQVCPFGAQLSAGTLPSSRPISESVWMLQQTAGQARNLLKHPRMIIFPDTFYEGAGEKSSEECNLVLFNLRGYCSIISRTQSPTQ
jgi:hypothetical protein